MANSQAGGMKGYWKCALAVFLVSMSPFQYGVDFGLIGGVQAMVGFLEVFGYRDPTTPVGWNITPGRQQLISSLMTLGAVIASAAAGTIAWKLGRKSCLWLACLTCTVGNVIMMATTSIGALYFGRLCLGIGNGLFMTFSQLYIQEVSPAKYRGLCLAAFQSWVSVGSLIGTIVDNFTAPLAGRTCYLIPLGLIYIIPLILAVGLFFIPESPRWLLEQGRVDQARKSMLWLRPDSAIAEAELEEIEATMAADKALKASASIMDMFRDPIDRRRTFLAVAAVATQAASGAIFMIAYGTYFFEMAGVGKPFENSCILVAVGVVAILINSAVITKYGRRRIFLVTGLALCGFLQLIVAIVYTVQPGSKSASQVIVAMSVLYIVAYNGMIATYAWLAGGELPSQRLRSYTFGLAASVGFLGAWLAQFTAPYFINPAALGWGPKYGYIWFPSCLIAAVFIFFYLPEVKDRTLEEITEMFEARLPARKFRSYQCVGSTALESKHGDISAEEIVFSDSKAAVEQIIAVS